MDQASEEEEAMTPTAKERAENLVLNWGGAGGVVEYWPESIPQVEEAIDQAYRDGEADGFQRGVEESKKVVECAIEQTVRAFEKASR